MSSATLNKPQEYFLKTLTGWVEYAIINKIYFKRAIMARTSIKRNKTVYQQARDEMDISREKASELTGLEPYRIERIENEKMEETPWDVVAMAQAYKKPELCNYYCANKCPIGEKFVHEIPVKDLSQVVLELLASLNAMQKRKDLLIEITADGKIGKEELEDFVFIQKELEKISVTVETLKLWTQKMIAMGKIDTEAYKMLTETQE